jgi:riboflavin kinase/FMN adenylyltransferase
MTMHNGQVAEWETAQALPLDAAAASRLLADSLAAGTGDLVRSKVGRAAVWYSGEPFDTLSEPCVVTIGAFDGVHRGHRVLVAKTIADARLRGTHAVAVTFDPDPMDLIAPGTPSVRLLTCADRIRFLASLGLDAIIAFPFDEELRHTTYEDFCLSALPSVASVASIHVGSDFHMGSGRSGGVEQIARLGSEHGFDVFGETLVDEGGTHISATRIRGLLAEGDLDEANELLCRCHFVRGTVSHGRGAGAGFGFPTANVVCAIEDRLPAEGVYAGYVVVDGRGWPAAINVGAPPTFSDPRPAFLEANLIGFEGDLYGAEVAVVFVRRLRPSRRFESVEELKETVRGNIAWTRENLGHSSVEVGR